MSQRDKLQAGIDSLGYRIAATGQNLADEPSERNGGNGLAYARKLVIYGKALEVLRRELEVLDDVAPAPEEPKDVKAQATNVYTAPVDERPKFGRGWF